MEETWSWLTPCSFLSSRASQHLLLETGWRKQGRWRGLRSAGVELLVTNLTPSSFLSSRASQHLLSETGWRKQGRGRGFRSAWVKLLVTDLTPSSFLSSRALQHLLLETVWRKQGRCCWINIQGLGNSWLKNSLLAPCSFLPSRASQHLLLGIVWNAKKVRYFKSIQGVCLFVLVAGWCPLPYWFPPNACPPIKRPRLGTRRPALRASMVSGCSSTCMWGPCLENQSIVKLHF